MMHRFFVSPQQVQAKQVILTGPVVHQMRHVLRMQVGQHILVLDNQGWEYEVSLVTVDPQQIVGVIEAKRPSSGEPQVQLTLYQGLMKRDKFEWVLQKGVEVGVAAFVPVVTQRSLVQTTAVKANKLTRWQRILAEAAEQARRGLIPALAAPVTWSAAMAQLSRYDLVIMPWEGAETTTLKTAVSQVNAPQRVALLIGPEGGFAAEEVALARQGGAVPVTLGPRILRAETAAMVAAALILHELGEMA